MRTRPVNKNDQDKHHRWGRLPRVVKTITLSKEKVIEQILHHFQENRKVLKMIQEVTFFQEHFRCWVAHKEVEGGEVVAKEV
jgi:hypothetical protein